MPEAAQPSKGRQLDRYGLEVKKEYLDLHKKYAPLWGKEEEERRKRWQDYLNGFTEGSEDSTPQSSHASTGEGFNSTQLEQALLRHKASGDSTEDEPWLQQLKTFVQAGIPMDLRGRLWKIFLQENVDRDPKEYDELVSKALDPQFQNSKKVGERVPFIKPHHLKGNSGKLEVPSELATPETNGHAVPSDQIKEPVGSGADWNAQIEKDLHRTFPGHPVMDRSGRRSLRRILSAYACRNPNVGYCQGMNFVAGCLLLFMEEEDAFWCLTVIVEKLLPGYFDTTMAASQVDQLVFKQLIESRFGRLSSHLDALGVNAISVSTQWFLCIYVNSLPLETCLRVWDIFFLERCSSVLYRVALSLIDIYAQALLATVDTIDAFILLQNMAPLSYDSSRLVDVACIAYADVNHEHMQQLRSSYEESVNARIQERLMRTRSQNGEYEGKIRSSSNVTAVMELVEEEQKLVKEMPFKLTPRRASLSSEYISKAAQTAYDIASHPAAAQEATEQRHQLHEMVFAGRATFSEDDCNREDLIQHIKQILDKRKEWLAEESDISDKTQEARVIHLKTLFARLEDEQFKLDAENYQHKVWNSTQVRGNSSEVIGEMHENKVATMQQEIDEVRNSIKSKEAKILELMQRRDREAKTVQAGRKRSEHLKTVVKRATAHRDLKSSLLQEKEELMTSLRQEIKKAEIAEKPPRLGLMSAFRSLSLRRTSKD